MSRPLQPLEFQILSILQSGQLLTVRWDCGGDESFVYTAINGEEQPFNYEESSNLAYGMDLYLTDLLELPGVGEFQMSGTGRIFQQDSEIIIDYQSEAYTYDDGFWMEDLTDEQLADMGYTRPEPVADAGNEENEEEQEQKLDQEMSDDYSGRKVLFSVG